MSQIRVLHILNELSNGGNCHFIMNYYRNIDREKVQFDFLVSTQEIGYFEEEITKLGGKVYHICSKKHLIKNFLETAKVVKENGYQIVHRHTGSAFGYFDLRAARKGGAKHLILHSHNTQAGNHLLHMFFKLFIKTECIKFACSKEAGEFLFGKGKDFIVINNAIHCDKFQYSIDVRKSMRQQLGLTNEFVIGNIGRFEKQKNHVFLLKIFKDLLITEPNSVLICVGDGSLREETEQHAKNLGIYENVKFLGARQDVAELLNVFDVFLLPSLYEGFGIVALEAQTSGLPCVLSNKVSKKVKLTSNVSFISLDSPYNVWTNEILKYKEYHRSNDLFSKIKDAGFDIVTQAGDLQKIYEGFINS